MFQSLKNLIQFTQKRLATKRWNSSTSFRPQLQNLESRELMTVSGWIDALPPVQMHFSSQLHTTLDQNTASRTIGSLNVRDNVTRAVSFVAPRSGEYVIETGHSVGHSNFDTVLGVYNASGKRLAYNDDANGTHFSEVDVFLNAGQTYLIGVGRYRGNRPTDSLSRFTKLTIDGPDKTPVTTTTTTTTNTNTTTTTPTNTTTTTNNTNTTTTTVNLGQKVVDWAKGRLGQQVGDGECATLVDSALKAAGAKSFNQLGPVGADADYVWGTKLLEFHSGDNISILNQIQPGDIIQFRNVVIHTNVQGGFFENSFPHHTAIVEANQGGGKLETLESNLNGVRTVAENVRLFADMTQGTIWVYRPIAA